MAKHKLKKIAIVCLVGLQIATFTACGKSSDTSGTNVITTEVSDQSETTANDTTDEIANQEGANTVYGEVTAVDGENVTIAVGTLNESPKRPDGGATMDSQSQERPDGEIPAEGQSQERPDGEVPTDGKGPGTTDGEAPQMQNGGFSMLTLTGEEQTISITDESIIKSEKAEDTETGLAAITVGATIILTYEEDADGNQTLSAVEIMGNMPGGGGQPTTED